jgi:hypothetical protein
MLPNLSDDGQSGTLFGQRVSAEFVMALIAKLGGRVEVNMFQEIERMRAAGVRIIAAPKFSLTAPDVYQLVDKHGAAWPPPAAEPVAELEEGVIEGEIMEDGDGPHT